MHAAFKSWRRPWALLALGLSLIILLGAVPTREAREYPRAFEPLPPDQGIRFACNRERDGEQALRLQQEMAAYLQQLGIAETWLRTSARNDALVYTLATAAGDTDTLTLRDRGHYRVEDEAVVLPAGKHKTRQLVTVSRKEILLALLQHGRLNEFPCRLDALQQQVELRQNIVAWTQELSWVWPNGGPARWNRRYWHRGTPRSGVELHEAVSDAFVHQQRYAIGCYTATKLILVQAQLDYYRRVRPDAARLGQLEQRLMADGEPLVGVEPGRMWDFEPGFDPAEGQRTGKLTEIRYGVAANNFVPGDWVYFLNTDPATYEKTGYEGSNAIYLGGGRFDDYYNDHHHAYTYEQKLEEVYQWRHGVFSRSRDAEKRQPLSTADLQRLAMTPAAGGLVLDLRVEPRGD